MIYRKNRMLADWKTTAALVGLAWPGAPLLAQEFPNSPVPSPEIGTAAPSRVQIDAPITAPVPGTDCQPSFRERLIQRKRRLQEKLLGYPEEFEEPPLGLFAQSHVMAQVANGQAAQMILHRYDFIDGTDRLNLSGKDHLTWIAARLPENFFPVVIERTPNMPGLDELRRKIVLRELCLCGFPIPAERIVIGPAIAVDLRGSEAIEIYESLLVHTRNGGSDAGAGSSGGGARSDSGAGRTPASPR
jgi:hypothetical protein